MEHCDLPVHLRDHDYGSRRRSSAGWAHASWSKCPCCRNEQVNLTPGPQHSATTAKLPRKRKRRSASRPSTPSARGPGKRSLVPAPPSTIPPADLPVAPNVPPGPPANQPSSTDVNHAGPVKIHNCSVEDYQRVYHEVVDDLLRYQSGRVRPYSLQLGRRIKWKLWERLDRPAMTSSTHQDGLTHVDVSYRAGLSPPLYDLDTLGEPSPGQPPLKGAKKSD
ncbi:uncharacterized protein LOC119029002 [Acanthopagrus latus]|uniref:uncharacterized protein LOC119029002 n=1 Tax=Acanthopagrus latus TaxID=8177 RepID=UPI00187CBA65|nr:uncharacterized protein LOC119029002 [Acanthopagrus latus]XP_036971391.1 uncharacterized protein LOC119029002 [Acanthopagrus latus]XP_036971392.1 uncharacterized protein LOC119029002 [Acanthopagrus latus]